jgi:transcriptional regulator with XRE-family HTH domain
VQPINEWLTQPGGLAYRLRELRIAAGLDQTQLAAAMGTSQAKVSRIENGTRSRLATEAELHDWAQATNPDAEAELLALRRQGEIVHHRWQQRLQADAAVQVDYDQLVRGATRIRSYQVLLIPGLVQTPDYARAVLERIYRINDVAPARIDAVVDARMQRQQVLYDRSKKIELLFTAAAMAYWPCPAPVMAGQLDRLMTATHLPNVTIGIIPSGAELAAIPQSGILIADDVTIVETPASEDVVHGEEALAVYERYAAAIAAEAVTGDQARTLITAAADALRGLP